MAILASGLPILHKAPAAAACTFPSLSLSKTARAGLAALVPGTNLPQSHRCCSPNLPISVLQQFREG